jgi:RiboL-PSP-HEPN
MTTIANFKSVETQVESYIDEIEQCLEFTKTSIESRPQLNGMVDWNNITREQRDLVQRFSNFKSLRSELMFRSLYISSHAFFESTIREIALKTVDYINEVTEKVQTLPAVIVEENICRSGHALSGFRNPLEQHSFNYFEIAKNVSLTKEVNASGILNADVLTMQAGNTTSDNMDKLFGRIAIALDWDKMCQDDDLLNLHGVKGARDSTNETKRLLSSMVKKRNRIAHEGANASDVSQIDLEFQLRFIRVFSLRLMAYISDRAKAIYGT